MSKVDKAEFLRRMYEYCQDYIKWNDKDNKIKLSVLSRRFSKLLKQVTDKPLLDVIKEFPDHFVVLMDKDSYVISVTPEDKLEEFKQSRAELDALLDDFDPDAPVSQDDPSNL